MKMPGEQRGDLILPQGEFALVQDGANGDVNVVAGPVKISPAETDHPVVYREGRFRKVSMSEAVQVCPAATESQYIVLTNPTEDEDGQKHPGKGKQSTVVLDMGRKLNIPGPANFALWPGQEAKVLDGHILRTNQFLVVRVTNGEEAMKNWELAVVKEQAPVEDSPPSASDQAQAGGSQGDGDKTQAGGDPDSGSDDQADTPPDTPEDPPIVTGGDEDPPTLTTGQLLIIKGTEVSFYIPPTGMEVVPEAGEYVRDAVTLEQLEYCILKDEDGNKEFVRGPSVVFPKPTQTFQTDTNGKRKFRAIELGDHWGIFVKVIAPYKDGRKEHEEGDELFITGKTQRIYFPRPEHSIVKYGDEIIHYAVAIPKGDARYVLNRDTGEIALIKGPKMFLPDPRKEVVLKRGLPLNLVKLLYPGNSDALQYNSELQGSGDDLEDQALLSRSRGHRALTGSKAVYGAGPEETVSADLLSAEEFTRRSSFTPPRTIQLDDGDSKYSGAVAIRIWTGYAVKIVNKTGDSRVVVGPKTVLLEYDELPEVIELSTGTPKSDDRTVRDVYLRVTANKVSDRVDAETSDFVQVKIPISYRVHFEGDNKKWFDVENYVKFLTDHLRSFIANIVKQHGIAAFNGGFIDILRNAILGEQIEGNRLGRLFEENGMRIYDVEIGGLIIDDPTIASMLESTQHKAVQEAIKVNEAENTLGVTKKLEQISRETSQVMDETAVARAKLDSDVITRDFELAMQRLKASAQQAAQRIEDKKAEQEGLGVIHEAELGRKEQSHALELTHRNGMLEADVQAVVEQVKAITPDMIKALEVFGDKEMVARVSQAMSPLAIIGGKSVVEVIQNLLKGTPLEGLFAGTVDPPDAESSVDRDEV
jgi:major vault protein